MDKCPFILISLLLTSSTYPLSGCRGAIVVAEARSADEPVLTRRCVVMKVSDLTTEKYLEAQRQNAAAIFILLPQNTSNLPLDTVQVRTLTTLECAPQPTSEHLCYCITRHSSGFTKLILR